MIVIDYNLLSKIESMSPYWQNINEKINVGEEKTLLYSSKAIRI